MATASCLLCEDHFLCSICLDVFTDPVTLPCGHNFCKKCIEQHWNYDCTYTCPYCKQVFKSKPDVKVNGFISEMAAKFRQSQSNASAQSAAHVEPVYCNFCTDPRIKALKSCLVCMASYCESHLEPHLHMTKRHKLVEPQRIPDNMVEERLTQMPDTEIQEMIAMRRQKIQQLYRFMELNNKDANLEITKGVQAFTDLKISVEGELDIFFEDISKKKKTMEEKAKGYIGELEGEISELKKGTRITKDLSNFGIVRPTYQGTAARSMAQLDEKLGRKMNVAFLSELQRVQKERVNVVLDPNKVHPRSTNPSNTKSNDDGPACKCVLATQTFSSGTFYFEVDVKDKSRWALGLAKDLHTNREVALTPQNSYWVICMRNKNELYAGIEPSTRLSLKSKPEKVGVFLDYGEGLVSFYDANKAAMIYTFTGCDFPQKLHPFFSPCANDGIHLHCTPDSSCVLQ